MKLTRERIQQACFLSQDCCFYCDSIIDEEHKDHQKATGVEAGIRSCVKFHKQYTSEELDDLSFCINCHSMQHMIEECFCKCRFTKKLLRDKTEEKLKANIKLARLRIDRWRKSSECSNTRKIMHRMEQLLSKMSLYNFSIDGIKRVGLTIEAIDTLIDEIQGLDSSQFTFPTEIQKCVFELLKLAKKNQTSTLIQGGDLNGNHYLNHIIEDFKIPLLPKEKPKRDEKNENENEKLYMPSVPTEIPPPMPDPKFQWQDKIYIDELLSRYMYGANCMSRILGQGGKNHKILEGLSESRVFFRGFGVSGELTNPTSMTSLHESELRLHVLVKASSKYNADMVRLKLKQIIIELDQTMNSQSRLQDIQICKPDHPFHFLVPLSYLFRHPNPVREFSLGKKFIIPSDDKEYELVTKKILKWTNEIVLIENDRIIKPILEEEGERILQIPTIPMPSKIISPQITNQFFDILNEWEHPYLFESHELIGTQNIICLLRQRNNIVIKGTTMDNIYGSCKISENLTNSFAIGEHVALSEEALKHFSSLLDQGEYLSDITYDTIYENLSSLRGVVRMKRDDNQLLTYLKYPWALYSDMHKAVASNLPKTLHDTQKILKNDYHFMGINIIPLDNEDKIIYRGYYIDWRLPNVKIEEKLFKEERGMFMEDEKTEANAVELKQGFSDDTLLQERAKSPESREKNSLDKAQFIGSVWLPVEIFDADDLRERIAGPNDSHFSHILKKFTNADLVKHLMC